MIVVVVAAAAVVVVVVVVVVAAAAAVVVVVAAAAAAVVVVVVVVVAVAVAAHLPSSIPTPWPRKPSQLAQRRPRGFWRCRLWRCDKLRLWRWKPGGNSGKCKLHMFFFNREVVEPV